MTLVTANVPPQLGKNVVPVLPQYVHPVSILDGTEQACARAELVDRLARHAD